MMRKYSLQEKMIMLQITAHLFINIQVCYIENDNIQINTWSKINALSNRERKTWPHWKSNIKGIFTITIQEFHINLI